MWIRQGGMGRARQIPTDSRYLAVCGSGDPDKNRSDDAMELVKAIGWKQSNQWTLWREFLYMSIGSPITVLKTARQAGQLLAEHGFQGQ